MRSVMWMAAGLLILGASAGCKEKNKEPVTMATDPSGDAGVMDAGVYSTDGTTDAGTTDTGSYGTYPVQYESSSVPDAASQSVPPANYGSGRMHSVQKGDTLYKLARQYYNNASRWKDIYEANRDQIPDPNRLKVGQSLVIP